MFYKMSNLSSKSKLLETLTFMVVYQKKEIYFKLVVNAI